MVKEMILTDGIKQSQFYEGQRRKMEETEENTAAFYLKEMSGIGNKTLFKLLAIAGNAQNIMKMSESEIKDVLGEKKGEIFWQGMEHAIKRMDNEGNKVIEQLKKEQGMEFVPFSSQKYPKRLRNIPDPPFALYVKGELPPEEKPSVGIIGARACSDYGKQVAVYFGKRLGMAGISVISGMARGIDGVAQEGAVSGGGKTYGVLGCGADVCYPPENDRLYHEIIQKGGIISEYSPGTGAQAGLFPARNRIISGLSDILLVIEARKRSGTYITVTQALEQGKDVYVVPGRITDSLSEGCNYLLAQGAGVALQPETLLEELASMYPAFSFDSKKIGSGQSENVTNGDADGVEKQILACLDIIPTDIQYIYEKVAAKTGISMQKLHLELTRLQIMGKVTGQGNFYKKTYNL